MAKGIVVGGIVLVALGAAAATPYYLGLRAEEHYHQQLTKVRQQLEASSEPVTIETVSYTRDWFESQAITRLTISPPELESPLIIELHSQVRQVPNLAERNLFVVTTTFEPKDDEFNDMVGFYFPGSAALTLTSQMRFDGSQLHTLVSPPYQGPAYGEPEVRVNWQGLNGVVEGDAAGQQANGMFSSPGLVIDSTNDKQTFTLANVNMHIQATQHSSGMWLGDSDITINTVSMTPPDGSDAFVIDKFSILSSQKAVEDKLDAEVTFALQALKANDFELVDSRYTVAMRSLDIATLQALQAEQGRLQQLDPERLLEDEVLVKLFTDLLSASPEFALTELRIGFPDGPAIGNLRLRYVADGEVPLDPMQLIAHLDAEAHARIPGELLRKLLREQVADKVDAQLMLLDQETTSDEREAMIERGLNAQLGAMLMGGYLAQDGENYTFDATLAQRRATLNGNDITPMLDAMLAQ